MNLLFLIPTLPLISFIFLTFPKCKNNKKYSTFIGITGISLSACISIIIATIFIKKNIETTNIFFKQYLFNWVEIDNFKINISLHLDILSLIMISIIIITGLLILLYSTWYMKDNKNYPLFFSYVNLFISNMIFLILSDNLISMYFFWEIVGFCSYLLIGFYYKKSKNIKSANKSFIMTRISDIFLLISILMIFNKFKTLNFHEISYIINDQKNLPNITIETFLLLIGAIGKSAQFPMHTWLISAMVGPTPVSALIHSSTMVTIGIYLINRTNSMFISSPKILLILNILSIVTILISGSSALVQKNIKKILAYSTISQLGYIFLALSIQAWNASIIHLIIHSFFKSLLFLSAGILIISCNNEQNITKMGGLKKPLIFIYICFLVGCSSLVGIPWISAGFYSKEYIFHYLIYNNNIFTLIGAILGTLFTIIYTFRMICIIFHGKIQIKPSICQNINCNLPLIILLILSSFIGFYIINPIIKYLPKNTQNTQNINIIQQLFECLIFIVIAYLSKKLWIEKKTLLMHQKKYRITQNIKHVIFQFLYDGWKIDKIYTTLFTNSYNNFCKKLSKDPISKLNNLCNNIVYYIHLILLNIENNKRLYRWYILLMITNSTIIITFLIFIT
ncbi:MAG: NADH:quinone oxidoreductase subunit L [Candidatus Westeberhardia cardiocondylae]|nr:NADH:quinone oxidoreductase subunit L [Candidatus Westeberhardia cardiocondylae]